MTLKEKQYSARLPLIRQWIDTNLKTPHLVTANVNLQNSHIGVVLSVTQYAAVDYRKLERILTKRFNVRSAQVVAQTIDYDEHRWLFLITTFLARLRGQLPAVILRKVKVFSEKLRTMAQIQGSIISVAGKLYGARHMKKVFKGGTMKYTGPYLQSVIYKKSMAYETSTGIIGVTIRIMKSGQDAPGRYVLTSQYQSIWKAAQA